MDLAAHWAGFETVRFVEKEPFCQKVLAKHWPNVPIDDDVFTSHPGHADVVCGGFPCQPFSVAGNRKGSDDERYLLPEMLRIVDEVKPYAVLFENVPGFPSLNDGTEFKYLLRTLAEMGFDAQCGHLRAKDAGAPHQRERWFLVAHTRDLRQHARRAEQPLQRVGAYGTSHNIIMAYPEHNGHIAATFTGRDAETVHDIAQGADSAREPARSDSAGTTPERTMGNADRLRLEGADEQEPAVASGSRSGQRQAQPRIRGTAHGLPGWLDFVGFPARPGELQHAYEPPRTAPSTPTTNARIKALGNAVVPQCA